MKKALFFKALLCCSIRLFAQSTNVGLKSIDSSVANAAETIYSEDIITQAVDTIPIQNRPAMDFKYGTLLNDDLLYNPKYPWWRPAARVVSTNVINWALDRYI